MRMISRIIRMFTSGGRRRRTPVGVGGRRRSGGGIGRMIRRFLR